METVIPYLAPAFGIVTGLILLCVGARLLKPAIGLGAGLLGAGGGFLLAPTMSLGISPFIVAIIFGIVADILAVGISKLAILLMLAFSFAVITPVITWQVAGLGDGAEVVHDVIEAASEEQITEPKASTTNSFSTPELEVYNSVNAMSQRAISMIRFGKDRIVAAWNAIPTSTRFIVAGAAVAGLLLGLLVATFMPYLSSALVTAFCGSILLRVAVGQLASEVWRADGLASINTNVLLYTTIGIALAGLGLQLTYSKKSSNPKQITE